MKNNFFFFVESILKMINFERKLLELEDCLKQIAEAIYYNSASIEKCNRDIKLHHSLGNLNIYIDSRQEMDRLSTREANLMKEKKLLLKERGHVLELICKNITEGEFII